MTQSQRLAPARILLFVTISLAAQGRPAVDVAAPAPRVATKVLSTGKVAIRVPSGRISVLPPHTGKGVPGPILGFQGPDGVWRGAGWVAGPTPVAAIDASQEGAEYVVTYAFVGGGRAEVRFWLPENADHIRVTEECAGCTSTWVLSFARNFDADRVLAKPTEVDGWSGIRQKRRSGQRRHGRLVFWSQFGRLLDFNDSMGVFGGRAGHDFAGFIRVQSDAWSRPSVNFLSLWERDGNLQLEGTWRAGRREWLLVLTARNGDEAADARQRMQAVEREWVWHRKGWVLDWDEPPAQYRPELARSERREKAFVLSELDRLTTRIVEGGYIAPPQTRQFVPIIRAYTRLRVLGALTPAEDRRARRGLAALGYNCYRKDLFPWDRAMLPPGDSEGLEPLFRGLASPTFNAECYAIVGELGLLFPDHPMSRLWVEHFLSQFRFQMNTCVYPGGCWEEGFSGAYGALLLLTPTAMRMRDLGKADLFTNERFRAMWEFFVQSATPRLADRGGHRSIPTIGDVPDHRDVRDLLLLGALAFQRQDPLFAGRLLWMHGEMGGTATEDPGRLLDALLATPFAADRRLVTFGLPSIPTSAPQVLSSVDLPGWGAIVRGGGDEEMCLVLRNGLAWGRAHNDDGSIHLYAKGAALVVDAGHGGTGPWQRPARGHSRVTLVDIEPANSLDGPQHGYRHSHRGQVRFFAHLAGAAYVSGRVPTIGRERRDPRAPFSHQPRVEYFIKPIVQQRHVLFLEPDHVVLYDELQTEAAHEFWLHANADRVTTGSGWVTFERRRGVALDALFLQPRPAPFELGEVRTTAGSTRYVRVAGDAKGDYRVVLFPRLLEQPRPVAREVAPGVIRLNRRDDWELVVLDKSLRHYRDRWRRVTVDASIAAVRHRGRTWTAVLFRGRSIDLPGLSVRPNVPLSIERDRHGVLAVDALDHAEPAIVRLEGRWLWRRQLHVPGQPAERIRSSAVEVNLPPGVNAFRIE